MTDNASGAERRPSAIRKRLPNRRGCEHIDFECAGVRFTASIGRFDDGGLSEIFIVGAKAGSALDAACRDASITFSIAMQSGADAETIRKGLSRDGQGRATAPLGVLLDLTADAK